MTRDEFLTVVAELVAGLQVPASISPRTLGTAYEPWRALLHEVNGGFGWTDAEQCRESFEKIVRETRE
jgi:hypothetical protein